MYEQLELKVRNCKICQCNQKNPQVTPLNTWKWLEEPWVWLHADYAVPFMGHIYVIIINAHLKWLAGLPVSTAISQRTMWKMKEAFVVHGLLLSLTITHLLLVKSSNSL